jgi:uncharacterized radical SAM superfamily Fe-S cluster-containing enzyme
MKTESAKRQVLFGTRGLCNDCSSLVEARLVAENGKVILEKGCLACGTTRALVSDDAQWSMSALGYTKPGEVPLAFYSGGNGSKGCPDSCGLCSNHQQHTCLPIIEITGRCDLACPICLTESPRGGDLSLEQIRRMVDTLVTNEGKLNLVNLSGGEPLIHPRFREIVDMISEYEEIGMVSVSTNGLALLEDESLARFLAERRVVVSLQFDGWDPGVYMKLRGRDLSDEKRRILDLLSECGTSTSLTMTLTRGANEGEVGSVLDLLFERDNILSAMFQPTAYCGRAGSGNGHDPMDVVTIPEVIRLIADQSSGRLKGSDFNPLPCSHPSCFALTYILKCVDGSFVPLPRIIQPEDYLDIIKNQALLSTSTDNLSRIKDAVYGLWTSSGVVPSSEPILKTIRSILDEINALGRDRLHKDLLQVGERNVKSIFIHHFMDRYTFDMGRIVKCCQHYTQPDGRLVPACVHNNLGGRQTHT